MEKNTNTGKNKKLLRSLHPILKPYWREIEVTLQPVIRITATYGKTVLTQSKFGGKPYWPSGMSYPVHSKTGQQLYMLAQINFAEVPSIDPFPPKGILQVYVDGHSLSEEEFQIIYHPEIINDEAHLCTDFGESDDGRWDRSRWGYVECSLQFEPDEEPVSDDDWRFERFYSKELRKKILYPVHKYGYEIREAYLQMLKDKNGRKNKIGGYHYSSNGFDPRFYERDKESVLLIQFDGCDVFSWGDLGSANFFIKKKDLECLNFSEVCYHWDST